MFALLALKHDACAPPHTHTQTLCALTLCVGSLMLQRLEDCLSLISAVLCNIYRAVGLKFEPQTLRPFSIPPIITGAVTASCKCLKADSACGCVPISRCTLRTALERRAVPHSNSAPQSSKMHTYIAGSSTLYLGSALAYSRAVRRGGLAFHSRRVDAT
jgi:hypothetical protein